MNALISKLRIVKNRFQRRTIPSFCSKSKTLSMLYYLFLDRSFMREQHAVLVGRVKHLKEAEHSKSNYFMLIRNTHRIEKGLIMRPRRPVFAKDYIKETIDCFEGVLTNGLHEENDQAKWIYDVLNEYFTAVTEDATVNIQKERFLNICLKFKINISESEKSIPYYRLDSGKPDISFESFLRLTKYRRSVRWFQNKPVDRDLLDMAFYAAGQSPTACNRQPYEFRVFDDKELLSKITRLPMGTAGYVESIPVMIAVVGNLDAYFDERDRHVVYIDGSLASMTLIYALETLGIGSCAINWPDIEKREKDMAKFLNLSSHQRVVMCLAVGYPDQEGLVAFSGKRSLTQIRKYN